MSNNFSVRTSKAAITALVLGILAFFCLGPLTAIPGIIFGIVALVSISRSQGSLKGFGLGLAGLITSAVGLIVGLLLWAFVLIPIMVVFPAFSRVHELANRTHDAAAITAITVACSTYADANAGHMPPDLFSVVPYLTSASVFKSKLTTTPELTSMPTTTADLDGHCDWIYIGADLTKSVASSGDIVLLYSGDNSADHGRIIAFADGHVVWVGVSDLVGVFNTSNTARIAAGLPVVFLDGPPPTPHLTPTARSPVFRPSPPPRSIEPVDPRTAAPVSPQPQTVAPVKPISHMYQFTDALDDLRSTDANNQRKAVLFLQYRKPVNASGELQHDVAVALGNAIDNPALRTAALRALHVWVAKENVAVLQKFVDSTDANDMTQVGSIALAVEALGATGDATTAPSIAKSLASIHTRDAATRALIALGPDAESAVWPYLQDSEQWTAATACKVLVGIGTTKSLPELDKLQSTKSTLVKMEAQAAVAAINAREK